VVPVGEVNEVLPAIVEAEVSFEVFIYPEPPPPPQILLSEVPVEQYPP
jgi:hypothetical protein